MTTGNLQREVRELAKSKSDALNIISGILGINIDGQPTVEVSSRDGFVWVRLRGNTSELIQAYNASVSPIFGLPVLVTRSGNKYSIIGRDVERYDNWGESSYLPKHGTQHSFAPELGFEGDVTWIYSRNIVPFLTMPSGSGGGAGVVIAPYIYNWNNDWKYAGDVGTTSLLGYKPTGTSDARIVLLYIDGASGTPTFLPGTPFSAALTGTQQIVPYIPDFSLGDGIPLAAIRLVTGTDVIGWDNIYDVRTFGFGSSAGGGGGGGSSIDTIGFAGQDEGVNLGTGTVLNAVGAGVTFTRSGTVFRLDIPSAAINTGTLDARYLKLSADNDPVTGDLTINANLAANFITANGVAGGAGGAAFFDGQVTIEKQGTTPENSTLTAYQELTNQTVFAGVLNVGRYAASPSDAPSFQAPVLDLYSYHEAGSSTEGVLKYDLNGTVRTDINPSKTGTGTAVLFDTEAALSHGGKLMLLSNAGTPRFWVNASGTAFERGNQLAKQTSANGTFTTADLKTVTVVNGIITSIV